ncbi:aprataxin and PNK-like factor isoform X2 [Anopheles darlingi]|uniref:aprataxin and PNK-like factor isoform X2 n=1 Tax=Anopheles darlingi TaxID=43151 RepID=UPI0021004FC0|nr:aprataxin and PNK-like factor isoform X2 [Anopheles darlingi]
MEEITIYDTTKSKTIALPALDCDQTIGRGDYLECDDKRVSRNHGTIRLTKDGEIPVVRVTALHGTNFIYYRCKQSAEQSRLVKDESVLLKPGDQFGLLPDSYWYEIRGKESNNEEDTQPSEEPLSEQADTQPSGQPLRVLSVDEVNSEVDNNLDDTPGTAPNAKRKPDDMSNDDAESDGARKRVCTDGDGQVASTSSTSTTITNSPSTQEENNIVKPIKTDPDATPSASIAVVVKPDPAATVSATNDVKPIVSNTSILISNAAPLRPSCDFGIRCYRAGSDHRTQFAHPGDRDYRRPDFPPAPPDAPFCPFGARCYRRNPQHFVDFQHPDPSSTTHSAGRRSTSDAATAAAAAAALLARYVGSDGSEEDDIDEEESGTDFDGSSSDEYVPGRGDDVDSESEANSNDDENDEE